MHPELAICRSQSPLAQLYRHADALAEQPALVAARDGSAVSYGRLLALTRAMAARLADAGVARGDRVVVVAGNALFFAPLVYAVAYLGGIVVPVNFRLSRREIAFIVDDCTPKAVVADAARAQTVTDACAGKDVRHLLLEQLADAAQRQDAAPLAPALTALEDDQAIMYTSGTTGNPKGAVLTYANFLAATHRVGRTWDLKPGARVLVATPMFHIAAFDVILSSVANGATAVVQPSVAFDADDMLDVMARHRISHTFMVPAQWQLLVNAQQRQPRDLQLRFYGWGAAPATQTLLMQLRETFPQASSEAAFGQTETTAIGVSMGHEDSLRKLGRWVPQTTISASAWWTPT